MSFLVPVTEAAAALGVTSIILHQFVGKDKTCKKCGKPRSAHKPKKSRTTRRMDA